MNTNEHETEPAAAHHIVTHRYVQRRIAQLPAGPEAADTRLRGLLAIFDDITAKGHPEPLALLASVLGIPVETLVSHLRAAGRPWGGNR